MCVYVKKKKKYLCIKLEIIRDIWNNRFPLHTETFEGISLNHGASQHDAYKCLSVRYLQRSIDVNENRRGATGACARQAIRCSTRSLNRSPIIHKIN